MIATGIAALAAAAGLVLVDAGGVGESFGLVEKRPAYEVRAVDAMTRVERRGAFRGEKEVRLYAARNETEPFQVVVSAHHKPLRVLAVPVFPRGLPRCPDSLSGSTLQPPSRRAGPRCGTGHRGEGRKPALLGGSPDSERGAGR